MLPFNEQIRISIKTLELTDDDYFYLEYSKAEFDKIINKKLQLEQEDCIRIYKNLLYFAFIKDVNIYLDFDDILTKNEAYKAIKACYFDINKLKYQKNIPLAYLDECMLKHNNQHTGNLKFFLYCAVASTYLKTNRRRAYDQYFLALSFLSNNLNLQNINIFDNTFSIICELAVKLRYSKGLTDLALLIIKFRVDNNLKLDASTYYNLALLYKFSADYDNSLAILDLYCPLESFKSSSDKWEIESLRASILMRKGNYDEGLSLLTQILYNLESDLNFSLLSRVCNNIIYFVSYYKLKNHISILSLCSDILTSLLKSDDFENRYNSLANLGAVHFFMHSSTDAYQYFCKSFDEYIGSEFIKDRRYIVLIKEALKSFKNEGHLNDLVSKLSLVNFDTLGKDDYKLLEPIIENLKEDNSNLSDASIIELDNLSKQVNIKKLLHF